MTFYVYSVRTEMSHLHKVGVAVGCENKAFMSESQAEENLRA